MSAPHRHSVPLDPGPRSADYVPRCPEQTPLYLALSDELETLLARRREGERHLPRFVERELRGFLDCGILAHGFLRVRCPVCREERLVPFSCKGRGFCPSCGGRRMADTAAWLVDRVLPAVPVRQWVLTLPFALRYRLAYDRDLCAAVLRAFLCALFAALRRGCPQPQPPLPYAGSRRGLRAARRCATALPFAAAAQGR
jgi:hypothetical protein